MSCACPPFRGSTYHITEGGESPEIYERIKNDFTTKDETAGFPSGIHITIPFLLENILLIEVFTP